MTFIDLNSYTSIAECIAMQVKRWAPLTEDWTPPELLVRATELAEMLNNVTPPRPPRHQWIQGERGLGKTLTTRIFLREIEARDFGHAFYMKCEHSLKRTLLNFCSKYMLKVADYEACPSLVVRKLIQKFSPGRVHLVIDDIDKLYHHKDVDGLVFSMYENLKDSNVSRSFTLVSRIPFLRINSFLEEDTLSRLQLCPIIFKPYNADEIQQILNQRLKYAIDEDQYEPGAISLLSAIMTRIGADIRKTLEVLRVAVELAGDKLNDIVVNNAWLTEKRRFWKDSLLELPKHQGFLAFIIACLNLKFERVPSRMVEREYRRLAKQYGFSPYSRRMIYYSVDKLIEKGYVERQRGKRFQNLLTLTEEPRNIIEAGKEIQWDSLFVT